MPVGGMMCSDFSVVVTGTPPSTTNSSESAWPRPMCTPPSIWPSASVGLIARPTSWAATTFASRPSSSRTTTCVAQPYAMCVTGSGSSFGRVQSTRNSPRNSRPASSSSRRPFSAAFRFRAASMTALPPSTVERDAVVWPVSSSRSVSTATVIRSGARPSSSHAIWRRTVWTPWPISVHEWRSVSVPSASGRRMTRPDSGTPLPMPVFFTPQAMPA